MNAQSRLREIACAQTRALALGRVMGHARPAGIPALSTAPTAATPGTLSPWFVGLRAMLIRRRAGLALAALHLAGLALVARLAHWPVWIVPLLLAIFSLPMIMTRRRGAETLAPLGLLYAVALLRLAWVYGLRRPAPEALSYAGTLAVSAAWAALIALRTAGRLRLAWIGAAVGTTTLLAWQLWRLAPAGVTGSDPFAYFQMGLDIAERGTALHSFPLAALAARLGLPTLPATHVGYVLPDARGIAPTVWPPGFSVLLAGAFRLGGETAALTLNAWIGLAAVILAGALGALIAPRASGWRGLPVAVGAGAASLVATSPELFTRLAVPLADGAALAFTTLAVCLVLVAVRRPGPLVPFPPGTLAWGNDGSAVPGRPSPGGRPWRRAAGGVGGKAERSAPAGPGRPDTPMRPLARYIFFGSVAGLALAAAYSVRYTQVLAGPGLLLAAWWIPPRRAHRLAFMGGFSVAAAVGALPDALYRTHLYGAPWRFGTGELALFSPEALPATLARVAAELSAEQEWAWLWPLALLGAAYAWRRSRGTLMVLLAAYGPVLMFHALYPYLRLRDLMSLLAPLAGFTALGGVVVLAAAWRWTMRLETLRVGLVAAVLVLAAGRLAPLLERQPGFYTFGYLLPEQRRAFEQLAVLTEPEAVVACSLNSGAVELYGRRAAVRPGNRLQPGAGWSSEQWLAFAAALAQEGRPLYVLADSPELDQPLADLRAIYQVEAIAALLVPVYDVGGGSENLTVPLYGIGAPD